MTPQHAQSSGGGSAGRAIVLVVLAVAVGVFLLARGFDGADNASTGGTTPSEPAAADGDNDDGGEDAENGSTTTSSSTTTSTTAPTVVTHPAGQVKVAVMNGTGERGRAGRTAESLNAAGYVTAAKNTEQDRVQESVIYYRDGESSNEKYGDDAKAVASVLGAPANIIRAAPSTIMSLIKNPETPQDLEDFRIFVVVGTDDVIIDPSPPAD